MFPVIHFALKLEAVVKLVHLDLLRVVARQNLGVNPSVGEITLGVVDLVGQIKGLDPLGHLTGQ